MSEPVESLSSPPLISVIVRSMDRPSLPATLASIAQQDRQPVEVLLVNALGPAHGPTPTHAGAHPLRRIDAGRPLPRSEAANAGLDAAAGPWVIFLDDDDLFLPGHLARLAQVLAAQPDAVAAYADVEYGHQGPEGWQAEHVFAADFDRLRLRFENFLPLHAVLVDRRRADNRFDESLDLFEDWDWWLQLSRRGRFVRVPGVSALYVAAAGGGSGVFAEDETTSHARERLLLKWQSLDTPADRLAQLRALQAQYRDAHHVAEQLALARTTEHDLRAMLDARDREVHDALAQIGDLRAVVAAREREIADGQAHAAALQEIVAARDVEISHLRGTPLAADRLPMSHSPPERSTVFTIVSRNYLHFALNLMDSVAAHLPGTRRVVVLCDDAAGVPALPAGVELIGIAELGIEHVDRMVVQYTILELNTAIKPFAFTHLFSRPGTERVIYFDPDIQLYASGEGLLRRLDQAEVVLTPHLTAPLADERHPSDLAILQSGTYNLGFLALRGSPHTQALLQWWQRKLARDCVVDIPRGLFTDQKWMDLVPGLYPEVHVERHPGWNVAYWNLAHRDVQGDDAAGYTVNGQPLFFFHFSGYSPGSRLISKHQDRFTLEACAPAVQALFAGYERSVIAHGRERFAALPYAFAALADGTVLPDCARQLIRQDIDWSAALPDFRSADGARFLIDYLLTPVDAKAPLLTRLALQLYRSREDLRVAFPDVLGSHRQAYADWFASRAGEEAKVPPALMGRAAAPRPQAVAAADSPAPAAAPSAPSPAGPPLAALPFRAAYKLAWNSRHLLRPLTTPQLRNRLRGYLVKRAYPAQPAAAAAAPATAEAPPFGVTVVGYLHAESGVGESARATLRALACTAVPHAAHDFRDGNVSRMGESVDAALQTGTRHAVSLFHINADQLPHARAALGDRWFGVPYRIGFWAWELEHFPAAWQGAFDLVDEVWVPSSFCQRAVAERSPVPVLCMPHAVAAPGRLQPERAAFGLRSDSVVFLAMADVMSSPERKNPFGAVEAYLRAFGPAQGGVELVVKVSNGRRDPAALQRLRALAAGRADIHLIEDYLDRPSLNRLLDSVDCFVSLHRAEGFGLVNAEAMVRGKVVIATAWSGNMDFMAAHNSMLVDYRLRTLEADIGPYARGQRWAEPDLDDAANQMRRVAADAGLRQRLGERARADAAALLAPPVVARQIEARLAAIRSRRGL
jgi:glycosyltransferase involved in cell wall biosynthesis